MKEVTPDELIEGEWYWAWPENGSEPNIWYIKRDNQDWIPCDWECAVSINQIGDTWGANRFFGPIPRPTK